MVEIFYNTPCKREIDIYLRNKRYSLINCVKLREEILKTKKHCCLNLNYCEKENIMSLSNQIKTEDEKIVDDGFRYIKIRKNDDKKKNLKNITNLNNFKRSNFQTNKKSEIKTDDLLENKEENQSEINFQFKYFKINSPEKLKNMDIASIKHEESVTQFNLRVKRKSSIKNEDQQIKKSSVLKEKKNTENKIKNQNNKFVVIKEKRKNHEKKMRKILNKNTEKNSGYKYITINICNEIPKTKNKTITKKPHEKIITFADKPKVLYHNEGNPNPILMPYKKPMKLKSPISKEVVYVKSIENFQETIIDGEFEYRLSKQLF